MGLRVTVYRHTDGALKNKWDIRVADTDNDKLLLYSSQGYENRAEAEWIAIRCLGGPQAIASLRAVSSLPDDERVVMVTELGDGDEKTRVIR